MNIGRMHIAVLGVTVLVLPSMLSAQMDPSSSQSPQGMNQPSGQQGASTPATGAQAGTSTSMRDSLGAPGETGQQMLDKQFVRTATAGNLGEVKLATLATQKGGPDVKVMAQKIADDHAAMNKDMATVADSMGVMLPKKVGKEDQAEYEKLNSLSGKDFDTEYLTYTVKAHWQDVHSFYMEATSSADTELQAEVVKAMGTMRQHFGLITKAATAEGITLPPRPPRPAATTAAK